MPPVVLRWEPVMHCEQAQRLFDAYLDGELSAPLATELGAHRLQCSDCRRALALLEVSEHILTLDQDPVTLDDNFTDRLVACVDRSTNNWRNRLGRVIYVGGPLAAAAVIALAFLGVFDGGRSGEVAGNRVVATFDDADASVHTQPSTPTEAEHPGGEPLMDRAQRSFESKRRSVESIQKAFEMTLQQPLNLLEQGTQPNKTGAEEAGSTRRTAPVTKPGDKERSDELEDL